ncbi:LOW QUALITY PROTEIN: uncharacterized protein [Amphiura filiformis]|uniref:LOW QUALITY PROTEIN: uncharacterized protein n=1 Tax=Amphiura filiformis TaxID=82378 RepID=UPI003B21F97C
MVREWDFHLLPQRTVAVCNAAPPGNPEILATTPGLPGCPDSWYLLNDRCYALRGWSDGDQLDFRDAEAACQQEAIDVGGANGHLANVPYDGINSLVTAFMKVLPVDVWIGLWSQSSGELRWIDTDMRYTYENFDRGQPSLDLNLDVCIKMLNDPDRPGKWLSVMCTNEFNAYMCQMSPDPQWDPNPPIVNRCPDEGYQSYFLSCYKFVTDIKSFADAQADCESEGAVLASFPDRYELAFGETVMHYNKIENIWIGFARDDQNQYKWIDGWPVTYTDWYRNEPTNDGCAAMTLNGWNDIDCTEQHAYFCKTTQETRPTPPPPQYGYCPEDGSIRWNDTCYYFPENAGAMDWDSANLNAKANHGASTLASVHSDDEALFLRTQATLAWGSPYPFWIGLELAEDGYYDWKDNTLMDYQNWRISEGEPNIIWPDGGRGCGFMPPESTEFHDDTCGTSKRFVCKVPLTYSEEPGCPSGWYLLDKNCYTLQGYSAGTQKTFYEAEKECAMAPGGHLAKIEYHGINTLITSFLKIVPVDLWIGLHTNNGTGSFTWISDDSAPSYTNWAAGQPSGDPYQAFCAKMFNDPDMPGEWGDVYCNEQENAYMCMQPPDPTLPANPPIASRCARVGYQSYYQSCYKFVDASVTFAQAKQACIDDSATIASFPDRYEQAFGITVMYANQVDNMWLGLEEDSTTGQLGWVDGWPLTYTDWKANEPVDGQCVTLTRAGWAHVPCTESHGYFCKYTQEIRPTVDPDPPGYCPSDWDRFDNNCYKFDESSVVETFDSANYLCQSRFGGRLVSIHNDAEGEFIRTTVNERYGANTPVWIGLQQDSDGNYRWIDQTLIDYQNWNTGEPNRNGDACGFLMTGGHTWGDDGCTTTKRYACKAPLFGTTGGCPSGWYKLLDKCYALFGRTGDDKKTYDEANAACRSYHQDASLASIQKNAQQSLLTSVMRATTGDIWIGLTNRGSTQEWHWQDGSPLTYSNWNFGQPDSGSDVCGKMHNDPNSPGRWIDVFCTDQNAYLCQQPVDLALPGNPPLISNCPDDWQSYFGSCFKIHSASPLTYPEAKTRCEDYFPGGTFLASVKDRYEQAFLETLFYIEEVEEGWFGLERNAITGRHAYSNGWPVDFTNWGVEEPTGDGCVAQINGEMSAYWEDTNCQEQKPYMCKYTLETVPTPPTIDPNGYCPSGWEEWRGSCYKFDRENRAETWDAAQYGCQTDFGSSLASIHDDDENLFVMHYAMDAFGTDSSIWIGLRRHMYGYFEWANREFVVFENWGANQPDGKLSNENCIEMQLNNEGLWNDDDCSDSANYVCKMPTIGAQGGCPDDWYKLDRKCYKLEGVNEPLTWHEAQHWCEDNAIGDGNLATVYHPGLQSFLTAIMKAFPIDVWIGFYTDNVTPDWKWADGQPVDYTAWGQGQPDGDPMQWSCVKMLNDPDMPGLWNDVACDDNDGAIDPQLNAFLCQSDLDPTLPGNPPIVSNCAREGYQSYFDSCFRVETAAATFADAQAVCDGESAQLASLADHYQEAFVKTTLYNNKFSSMWLGLMGDQDTGTYGYVDGWPLTFTQWGENEPSGEGCVTLKSDETWDAIPCDDMRPFICKYTQAVQPPEPTPPSGNCPNGWDRFNDNCYLFDESLSPRSFDAASYECQSQFGARLASVHNNDELEFIRTRAGSTFTASSIWIGMQRWDDRFRWTDQSLIDYVNWDTSHPGMDNCVEMDIDSHGRWSTDNCNDNSAFICKSPVLGNEGGCPSGWYRLRDRCYKLGGMTEATRKTWQNAQADCKVDGGASGYLASINVYGIQSLLTAILKGVTADVWIGLNNIEGDFEWADGTPVTYTSWAPGQPDSGDGVCVKMGNDVDYFPGSWIDVYCSQENAYLCQTVTDPLLPGNPPIPTLCQRDGYQSYFQSCMRVVTTPMTFVNAQAYCANEGAMLASLEDRYEQAFVEVTTLNNEADTAWIGLQANSATGVYEWTDDWPLTYTKWAVNEPSRTASSGGCVGLNHDYNGAWEDFDCNTERPFICKYTSKQTPPTPPVEQGYCPDGWDSYMGSCYNFKSSDGMQTWDQAQYECQTDYGSHLVYIHNNEEANWVSSRARAEFGTSAWVWLGIRRDFDNDMYMWSNQDLVDYVNWASAPSISGSCGEMLSSSSEWREQNCLQNRNFVCKIPQLGPVGGCEDGWYKLLDKCYKLGGALDGTQPLTWYDAKTQCNTAAGGHLAQVFNSGLQGFLTAILKGLEDDVWIGLSTVGQTGNPREFRWEGGGALDYINWTPGQPDGDLGNDNCVKMLNDPDFPGTWNDVVCTEPIPYLCEADLDPTLPANPPIVSRCLRDDYQSYISNCFKIVTTPMTYTQARQYCVDDATELAFFADKYEQAFVQTVMYNNEVEGLWLGMNQESGSNAYSWESGWPLTWTNWGMNEPSGEGCLAFIRTPSWETHDCNMAMPFMCKYNFDSIPTEETPPTGNCPSGWTKWGTACYYIEETIELGTWDDAQYACNTNRGSNLVSVHSQGENNFLQERASSVWARANVWLGMDRDDNQQFEWTDQSTVNYVNWNTNEPNGAPAENCVEFNSETGTWGDEDCTDFAYYICKLPLMDTIPPTEPPVPTEPPGTPPTAPPQTGLSTGAIAGIAVGAAAGLLLFIGLVYFCSKEDRKRQDDELGGGQHNRGHDSSDEDDQL